MPATTRTSSSTKRAGPVCNLSKGWSFEESASYLRLKSTRQRLYPDTFQYLPQASLLQPQCWDFPSHAENSAAMLLSRTHIPGLAALSFQQHRQPSATRVAVPESGRVLTSSEIRIKRVKRVQLERGKFPEGCQNFPRAVALLALSHAHMHPECSLAAGTW